MTRDGGETSRARAARRAADGLQLWLVALGSLALWALGVLTSFTLGGFIHVLLLFSIALMLIRLIPGPRAID